MANILIVDDEIQIRDVIRLSLEAAEHEVVQAGCGTEALRILAETDRPIDLVITDILMPDGDGIELLASLRRHENAPPVVAITGGGLLEDCSSLDTAKSLGASSVMTKPLSCVDLHETVEEILAKD